MIYNFRCRTQTCDLGVSLQYCVYISVIFLKDIGFRVCQMCEHTHVLAYVCVVRDVLRRFPYMVWRQTYPCVVQQRGRKFKVGMQRSSWLLFHWQPSKICGENEGTL